MIKKRNNCNFILDLLIIISILLSGTGNLIINIKYNWFFIKRV